KHSPRFEVQVKARRMGIAASFMAKMGPSVGLVGLLVSGEAHIAMDAKQRAPIGASVGHEARADLPQGWPNITDEAQHGTTHIPLIALFVGLKPLAVVVAAQCLKESKQGYVKVRLGSHADAPYLCSFPLTGQGGLVVLPYRAGQLRNRIYEHMC